MHTAPGAQDVHKRRTITEIETSGRITVYAKRGEYYRGVCEKLYDSCVEDVSRAAKPPVDEIDYAYPISVDEVWAHRNVEQELTNALRRQQLKGRYAPQSPKDCR